MRLAQFLFFILSFIPAFNLPAGVILHKKDATVWGQIQKIQGELVSFFNNEGILYLNGMPIPFQVSSSDSSFEVPLALGEGLSTIVVEIDSNGTKTSSDSLKLTLGYQLRPEIYAFATVLGTRIQLHAKVLENPSGAALSFFWQADAGNPAMAVIDAPHDSATLVTLPANASYGEYHFKLTVVTAESDTTMVRTFVTLDSTGLDPFQIKTDHASWIDRAVLYEITPTDFVDGGKFQDIIEKIPELAELGVTALWLQPTFQTPDVGGMGYGITDYFAVRTDLGTETDLHRLIESAHDYGLKILLDIVPNHTYLEHPYALNTIVYGTDSHYYHYYQRDAAPNPDIQYSEFYHRHPQGFVYYFWELLPNLNYDHPEVRRWMTEVCKFWLEKYDIDGYRFDAVWGVTARNPEFSQTLRLALKRIKPEILLLAEDKASWPNVFEERFDVAFDWASNKEWVSQWSWQVLYHDYQQDQNITIFNSWQQGRSSRLRNALTNNGEGYLPNAKILRFLENNDSQRFIRHHGLERTKMAAALAFSLPGLPLIYNGQEVGFAGPHPYWGDPIFKRGQSIQSQDAYGLFRYYQHLIKLKKTLPAFCSDNYEELPISPPFYVFAFWRWSGDQNVFVALNMSDRNEIAELILPIARLNLDSTKIYYLTDLLSGHVFSGHPQELEKTRLTLNKYTTQIYILADTVTVTGGEELAQASLNTEFELQQNYPNPFNPATMIRFTISQNGPVSLKVYNVLGELVTILINDYFKSGKYEVLFNGKQLASGIYWYRLDTNGGSLIKKMVLIR